MRSKAQKLTVGYSLVYLPHEKENILNKKPKNMQ